MSASVVRKKKIKKYEPLDRPAEPIQRRWRRIRTAPVPAHASCRRIHSDKARGPRRSPTPAPLVLHRIRCAAAPRWISRAAAIHGLNVAFGGGEEEVVDEEMVKAVRSWSEPMAVAALCAAACYGRRRSRRGRRRRAEKPTRRRRGGGSGGRS